MDMYGNVSQDYLIALNELARQVFPLTSSPHKPDHR